MADRAGLVRFRQRPVMALVPLAAPAIWLLTIVTYRESAHGALDSFLLLGAFCCGAGLTAFAGARLRWPNGRILHVAALLLVPLLFLTLHGARLGHPARRGAPFVEARDAFDGSALDERLWELMVQPPASAAVRDGTLRLTAPAGTRAAVELHARPRAWWTGPPANLLLPAGFDERNSVEEVTWTASATLAQPYLVMAETERLVVQLERGALRLLHRAPSGLQPHEVAGPEAAAGRNVAWRLLRGYGEMQLFRDGALVWRAPETAPLGWIRFGETRSDPEHGGVLEIDSAAYRRWWQAP